METKMIEPSWTRTKGTIVEGHKVASGQGLGSPYPQGTIETQTPFFKKLGLDLSGFFRGTLNISIGPKTFKVVKPEITFRGVEWTSLHPPEDFSFSRCRILNDGHRYEGWIYYPHPETKKRHFQKNSIIEVIAPFMPQIKYGLEVEIETNSLEMAIIE